jgi:hypothetical protein
MANEPRRDESRPHPPDSEAAQDAREAYGQGRMDGPPEEGGPGPVSQNLGDARDVVDSRRARAEDRGLREAPVPDPGPDAPRRRGRGWWVGLLVIAGIVVGLALGYAV